MRKLIQDRLEVSWQENKKIKTLFPFKNEQRRKRKRIVC